MQTENTSGSRFAAVAGAILGVTIFFGLSATQSLIPFDDYDSNAVVIAKLAVVFAIPMVAIILSFTVGNRVSRWIIWPIRVTSRHSSFEQRTR